MRLNYIPRRNIFEAVNYGYLYNWYAAAQPQSINRGYLYNWHTADDVRDIANTGWSVPSNTNFNTLASYLGGTGIAGGKLKETSLTYWLSPNTGATNETGFNARSTGERQTAGFSGIDQLNRLWTSNSATATNAVIWQLAYNSDDFISPGTLLKYYGVSVRLLKDSTTLSDGETGTYVGNDGRVYKTICIGTQEWLSENLMETKYQNGDAIPEVTDNTTWAGLTTGARCSYNDLESNAVVDTEIANVGWSVPANSDHETLALYLEPTATQSVNTIGGKLKEVGLVYWNSPNTGATNETGFNGRGSGIRTNSGTYGSEKVRHQWWARSSTTLNGFISFCEYNTARADIYILGSASLVDKKIGSSLRLLKDTTTLTDGQTGIYEGNDGKKYPTICIGTQEWLAANLKETKYRDGSLIPVVTDNAVWAALTTGARCVLNNNEANA